jgi:glycosyltransferase involved in cell wall biosynthesis
MRVLLVSHYYPEHRSGVEIIAGELARRLAARGVEIVWAASAGDGDGPAGAIRLPMRAWNVAERRLGFPYPLWCPASLGRLSREVGRCDLVHLHDSLYLGNVVAYLCARRQRKPVVVTQHIGLVPYSNRALRALMALANRTLARMVLGGARRCVFYSPHVEGYFTRFVRFQSAPQQVPNGVNAKVFFPLGAEERLLLRERLGWPADRRVFLFVGRFVEKKGLGMLRLLAGQLPDCDWKFVGWGPEAPDRWGLANVQCLGPRPQHEIAAYYQAADLLVLPSVGEGFPLVVQEAMACGLPAMISTGTAHGAPKVETVLFTEDLRLESWAGQLRELDGDPALLAARRPLVADFARRWDWDACAEHYLRIFESAQKND